MAGTTQNGWPIDGPLRQYPVAGSGVTLTLTADNTAAQCLLYAARTFHAKIQALDSGQCGGYDKRPIGGLGGTTSNHRSGTAMDLNYTNYPQGAYRFNAAQKAVAHQIISDCQGVLRWGGDYGGGSLVDEQHFEINTTNSALIAQVAAKVANGVSAVTGSTPTAATANTAAATAEPLPAIGPAAQHALIPLTRLPYFDASNNRLADVLVNGAGMTGNLVTAVTGAGMSFSNNQVGQFTLTVQDTPDGSIIGSGIFAKGTSIDFRDQHLEVRGLDIRAGAGGPQLTVKARSRVVGVLRGPEHTGKGSWGDQDVTAWVLDRCREAGAHPVVQGDLGTATMTRQTDDETTWDSLQRAAQQVGAWCWEHEQILTFGRPTWIAARNRVRWWDIQWTSHTNMTNGLIDIPSHSWSADGGTAESLTWRSISGDADLIRPGDGCTVAGNMGAAQGDWIVTSVDLPASNTKPVQVSCARIVDPAPSVAAGVS